MRDAVPVRGAARGGRGAAGAAGGPQRSGAERSAAVPGG